MYCNHKFPIFRHLKLVTCRVLNVLICCFSEYAMLLFSLLRNVVTDVAGVTMCVNVCAFLCMCVRMCLCLLFF